MSFLAFLWLSLFFQVPLKTSLISELFTSVHFNAQVQRLFYYLISSLISFCSESIFYIPILLCPLMFHGISYMFHRCVCILMLVLHDINQMLFTNNVAYIPTASLLSCSISWGGLLMSPLLVDLPTSVLSAFAYSHDIICNSIV